MLYNDINLGAYHYHANINCTDAGAATGANDSDECVLIGDYDLTWKIVMEFLVQATTGTGCQCTACARTPMEWCDQSNTRQGPRLT